MLRITKQTDYGIVLLTHLAAEPARLYNAPELAAEARLPLPMVSKILKMLARDGPAGLAPRGQGRLQPVAAAGARSRWRR